MRGGGQRVLTPLENHKLLFVSLEILVRVPLEKKVNPIEAIGPIASKRRTLLPSVKYVDSLLFSGIPPTELSESAHVHGSSVDTISSNVINLIILSIIM